MPDKSKRMSSSRNSYTRQRSPSAYQCSASRCGDQSRTSLFSQRSNLGNSSFAFADLSHRCSSTNTQNGGLSSHRAPSLILLPLIDFEMSARVPLLFGTATIGEAGTNAVRITDLSTAQRVLDTFYSHGYKELDTARIYGSGTTETFLSKLDLKDSTIDTKIYPLSPGDHKPKKLRATFLTSLKTLGCSNVRVLYLHAPDNTVPIEETLQELDKLHKEGL